MAENNPPPIFSKNKTCGRPTPTAPPEHMHPPSQTFRVFFSLSPCTKKQATASTHNTFCPSIPHHHRQEGQVHVSPFQKKKSTWARGTGPSTKVAHRIFPRPSLSSRGVDPTGVASWVALLAGAAAMLLRATQTRPPGGGQPSSAVVRLDGSSSPRTPRP